MYKKIIQGERERVKSEYHAWRAVRGPYLDDDRMLARRTSSLISKGKVRSPREDHHVMFVDRPVIMIGGTQVDGADESSLPSSHKRKSKRFTLRGLAQRLSLSTMSFLSLSD